MNKSFPNVYPYIDKAFVSTCSLNPRLFGRVLSGEPRRAFKAVCEEVAAIKNKELVLDAVRIYFTKGKKDFDPRLEEAYNKVFCWLDCVMFVLNIGKVQNATTFPVALYRIEHPKYRSYGSSTINLDLCQSAIVLSHELYSISMTSQLSIWSASYKLFLNKKELINSSVNQILISIKDLTWSKTKV